MSFEATQKILEDGVREGVAPGFVAGAWRASEPESFVLLHTGQRRIHPAPEAMTPDTIFDLASVTKVMATATLVALLVDRGWLAWDLPITAVLPDYPHGKGIELRHLLSHTAGLPAWAPFWEKIRDRYSPKPLYEVPIADRQRVMRELVYAVAPEAPVESRALYSDLTFLLLGFALEEVLKLPLDRAVGEHLWRPMGVTGAFYARVDRDIEKGRLSGVAATEDSEWRGGVLQGQVHDDNCWSMGGYAGHAGAFGRATDVLTFAKKMLTGFISEKTLQAAWSRVPRPAGCERTLGWDTPSREGSAFGANAPAGVVGHLGFTGTSLWIDPQHGVAITLLSNRVHPTRENNGIRAFRPRFHDVFRRELSHT